MLDSQTKSHGSLQLNEPNGWIHKQLKQETSRALQVRSGETPSGPTQDSSSSACLETTLRKFSAVPSSHDEEPSSSSSRADASFRT